LGRNVASSQPQDKLLPSETSAVDEVMSPEQLALVTAAYRVDAWADVARLSAITALRPGEMAALTRADVDREAGVLVVRRSVAELRSGELIVKDTKNHTQR